MSIRNKLKQTERELRIRNYSPKTIKSYLYGLQKYFVFKKKNLECLNTDSGRDFLFSVQNNGVSAQTRNLYLSSIKFFYRDVIEVGEKIRIQSAKRKKSLPVVLSRKM